MIFYRKKVSQKAFILTLHLGIIHFQSPSPKNNKMTLRQSLTSLFVFLLLTFTCKSTEKSPLSKKKAIESSSDSVKFPDDWLGIYKGALFWKTAKGTIEIPMTFELIPYGSLDDVWYWRTTYDSTELVPRQVVKDYLLRRNDSISPNHFILDEGMDILLDMVLIDNQFYCLFDVDNTRLASIDRLESDGTLYHEIISANVPNFRQSLYQDSLGNTISDIKSLYQLNTQKAVLKKVK